MRKPAALLTVLLLAGSMLGLICHCCPTSVTKLTQSATLASQDCGCCPHAVRADERSSAVKENLEFLPASFLSRIPYIAFVTTVHIPGIFEFQKKSLSDFGPSPPFSFSGTPLYLAERILRL